MNDILNPQELKPKDILQFVENRAERAVEVLREIIDVPEYDNVPQAVSTNIAWPTNILGNSTAISMVNPMPMQQEGFNGR